MNPSFDPNLFRQIGAHSASLTMLTTIVHRFRETGEYRGILYRGSNIESVFRVTVDKNIAVAQANIDLAALKQLSTPSTKLECCDVSDKNINHFQVNLDGYLVFHVSHGPGGYSVRVEKADQNSRDKPFFTGELNEGDYFSVIILRPGTYSIVNQLNKTNGEIVVSYPRIGKTPYRPPDPVRIECTKDKLEPNKIKLEPGQGQIYQFKTPSRIKIELLKADDGPDKQSSKRMGWQKTTLPKKMDNKKNTHQSNSNY
jgi:hypothetical protein